jgi:hypothetical protein
MAEPKKLRVFISSPSDVVEERAIVYEMVELLNRFDGIASTLGFNLEIFDWRSLFPSTIGQPQEVIINRFPPTTWDIFIGIFWHRFGSPTGNLDDRGRPYLSGTEQEIDLAIKSWRNNNRPKLLLFRKTAAVSLTNEEDIEQISSVQKFFSNLPIDLGQYGLYKTYSNKSEFERKIFEDLTKALLEYGFDEKVITTQSKNVKGNLKDYRVFISHSSKDLFIARQVAKEIRSIGVKTWLDDNNLEAGGILVKDVLDGIKGSNEAVVLLSSDSVQSQWVNAEIGAILALDKRLTPLLINVDHNASQLIKDRLAIHVNEFEKYLDQLSIRC